MVEVRQRQPQEVRAWATRYIPLLLRLWTEFPAAVDDIDNWDETDALVYLEEWPLYEDQRKTLNAYAIDGILTAEQRAQLNEVNRLAEHHGPKLHWLLNGRKPRQSSSTQ